MWRRPVVTVLMLVIALILTLPMWAQQANVAPGLSPAQADVAASLPRHGGVPMGSGQGPPPLRHADLKVSATTPGITPTKPFTQEQVSNMVRDGFGDDSGAKLIEQRGIDFAPTEDLLQSLKAAGANEAFLKALRAAKKPLDQVQVILLLAGQVPSHRVSTLVRERGIDFDVKDDYLQEVRLGGGDEELITALKSAKVTKAVTVDPTAQARQAEVRQHVARGAELAKKGQYAQAEQEYRAALLLDSQNAHLYVSLAHVLSQQKKWDDAAAAARQAVRLDPTDDFSHGLLGWALQRKGDFDGAVAEYREAVRLNPTDDLAHVNLGIGLGRKGDVDGEIAEEREALRLNPNDDDAHFNLGVALETKGDWDGAIAEYREVVRLDPDASDAHYFIGMALEKKGDLRGALEEFRAAYMLDPKDVTYKQNYERLLQQVNQ
jgi:Flp pilus assembly protein TadD